MEKWFFDLMADLEVATVGEDFQHLGSYLGNNELACFIVAKVKLYTSTKFGIIHIDMGELKRLPENSQWDHLVIFGSSLQETLLYSKLQ